MNKANFGECLMKCYPFLNNNQPVMKWAVRSQILEKDKTGSY